MNFALVVRLGHHRRGEVHVTYMAYLRPVADSVVTVLLTKTHSNMNHLWLQEASFVLLKKDELHVITTICSLKLEVQYEVGNPNYREQDTVTQFAFGTTF